MAIPRFFLIGTAAVFVILGGAALISKKPKGEKEGEEPKLVQQIVLAPAVPAVQGLKVAELPKSSPKPPEIQKASPKIEEELLPEENRIPQLFTLDSTKLSIVETVAYTSRVPWLKGRPAWIADYAAHYSTSRHFIARSLNRNKPDYFTQKVSFGDRFNVFKRDKNLNFHLLIDLSRCRMWFYYIDLDVNERVLLKTYRVGVGRVNPKSASGYLTPVGKYQLGGKIAIYKPGTMGFFQDRKMEMIRVFGTRWIPFEKELEGCTESARGLGLHGAPWVDASAGQITEDLAGIGKYDSDGCIRLASDDIEEIFSIIITKPTTVELVKDFNDAKLPGVEKK